MPTGTTMASPPASTVGRVLKQAASQLASNSASARLDAEILLALVLGVSRVSLLTWPDQTVGAAQLGVFEQLVRRRAAGEPIAYLTGQREFWSFRLQVTPHTLIPRPETELLVEQALARIPAGAGWTLVDLGTGSGAVALAFARERPACRVIATDLFAETVAVARRNARRLHLPNVHFLVGHWVAPLRPAHVNVIASNPPYIPEGDPQLSGELRFEPGAALRAGRDGLKAITEIATDARGVLAPNGWLVLEHGYDQAKRVAVLLNGLGYQEVETYTDLAELARVTVALWPAATNARHRTSGAGVEKSA